MKQLQSFKYFGLRQFQQANPTPIKKMRSFAYIQGWGGGREGVGGLQSKDTLGLRFGGLYFGVTFKIHGICLSLT